LESGSDPGQLKWCPKEEKICDFKIKRVLPTLLKALWFPDPALGSFQIRILD